MIFVVLFNKTKQNMSFLVWWLALWPFLLGVRVGPAFLGFGFSPFLLGGPSVFLMLVVGPSFFRLGIGLVSLVWEVLPSFLGGCPFVLRGGGWPSLLSFSGGWPFLEWGLAPGPALGQPPPQEGRANPNPKKEGSTTSMRKTDGPEKGGPALTPRRKGQNPNPKKAGPTTTPQEGSSNPTRTRKGQPQP